MVPQGLHRAVIYEQRWTKDRVFFDAAISAIRASERAGLVPVVLSTAYCERCGKEFAWTQVAPKYRDKHARNRGRKVCDPCKRTRNVDTKRQRRAAA